jgi:hypothetical protein
VRAGAVVVLAALSAGVLAGSGRAADASLQLAQRYAPVVRLVEQKEQCGHGEPFVPTDVRRILGNPDVALRGPWDKTNIIKVAPTAADLSHGLFDYHLDFPGNALSPGCTYDTWSHRINEGSPPRDYARVATEADHPNELALQYWFFYVYNDFNNKHEGDWEMIQLDFDAATAAAALRTTPALVGYSQHEGAESSHWDDSKLERVDGSHPVVYASLGSHANYYTAALHLGRSAAQGVGCDETSPPSRQLRPEVSLIPTARRDYLRAYPWLGFEGRWGEEHQSIYNGPTGPAAKRQWAQPISWANETWRDTSYTVPVGSAVGSTATDFFCGAVAAGSSALTALVGNPSPFLLGLALLVIGLLWLISRTQWHPSAPLRLERRRRWGAIVNASRRMYFAHPGTFLGIGLVFFPLGVAITALQYLLFHVGGLNGLVESAGKTNAAVEFLVGVLEIFFAVLGLAVVQTVTAIAIVEIDEGRDGGALAAYRKALPKLPGVLATVLAAAIAFVLASLTAIGALIAVWLLVRWSFFAQAVALEARSPRGALRRSARLVQGNWWRVASLLVFITAIALLLGPVAGTLLLFVTDASFYFVNVVASVVYAAVLPFAAIATTYLFVDLRLAHARESEAAEAADVLPADEPTPPLLAD